MEKDKPDIFLTDPEPYHLQSPSGLCAHQLFEKQVEQSPDAIAASFGDQHLTYRQLDARANRLANYLQTFDPKPDTLVCICVERSLDMAVGILGILKAGCAYVPLDPEYPKDRLAFMIEDTQAPVLLTQQSLAETLPPLTAQVVCLDTRWEEIARQKKTKPLVHIQPDHLAYVIYTSGSTGTPKGVAMPHRPLVNLITWQLQHTSVTGEAKTLQFAPLSFDVSFQEMFATWCGGGTLVLVSDELRLDTVRLLQFINETSIERLFLPFIALHHLAEVAENNDIVPHCLREVITAGEQLQVNQYIVNLFTKLKHCRFYNQYGPSETHVVTAYTLSGDPGAWPPLPPIGTPVANTQIYLLDDNLQPVERGKPGELCIGGVCLARGYLNRPELTGGKFIKNPFTDKPHDRLYKTGDLALYQPDGNIAYLGRMDGQVKVRGYRIEPGEIEVALGTHPAVKQAVVTVREDDPGNKRLVAYIIAQEGRQASTGELRRYLEDRLPDYMIPGAFVTIDTIPRTPSGKIDRRAFPAPVNKRPDIDAVYIAPQNRMEHLFSRIWCKLLRLDRIGVHDSFFHLGGNSLLAVQSVEQLRQKHGIQLPVTKIFQYPTISELTGYVSRAQDGSTAYEKVCNRIALQKQRLRWDRDKTETVAIIGMAGRFPGATHIEQLWENLCNGVESITFFENHDLDPCIDDDLKQDSHYIKARGIINDADRFDAQFFGMSPREAEIMDPQQRVFLEVVWEALESAGYIPELYEGLVGIYAGMSNNKYFPLNVASRPDLSEMIGDFHTMLVNEKDYLATHVAHKLNLTGPCVNVYTACSTSLVALYQARISLLEHQCDIALAGGVTVTAPIKSGYLYQEGGMYSADGHTRPFDDRSSGTVFSDGAGVVVLKRLSEALKDRDHIYAVIMGGAVNNDGAKKSSFTAPSMEGQASAIIMAQADAGVDPESISYIETHGTATPLGDPIEFEALTRAFRHGTRKDGFCAVGSIKSNMGHLNAAAGVAGVMKTALSLKHGLIPPSLNFKNINSEIDIKNSPFYVNTRLSKWPDDQKRRAGVSSFGVGGTNAHVLLEGPPSCEPSGSSRPRQLLLLSARTGNALDTLAENMARHLKTHPDINLADVAYTLQVGRKAFGHRGFAVCGDAGDVVNKLASTGTNGFKKSALDRHRPPVVFMFPGQGTQYVNMGLSIYTHEPVFRDTVDECSAILKPILGKDLRELIYPVEGDRESAKDSLRNTVITQPALFTIEYALAALWRHWGVSPQAMIGHSIGEFVAGCLAGVFSLEDALVLVAARGRMMSELPQGAMLSVRLPAETVKERLSPALSVAAVNGPSLCVVSGPTDAVNGLKENLEREKVACRHLHTSHAFHSPMVDPIVAPFIEKVKKVQLSSPEIPFVSTATATWITPDQATDPVYWGRHMRETVQFAQGIRTLWADPHRVLLEVGPRNTAAILARQQAKDKKRQIAVSSLGDTAANQTEWEALLTAVGQLWLSGISIDWDQFYQGEQRNRLALPTYPFERKRYWIEPGNRLTTSKIGPPVDGHSPQQVSKEITNGTGKIKMNTSRKERFVSLLENMFQEISGEEITDCGSETTFLEMGFDSLFLTQVSMLLKKRFGAKIKFRQLIDEFPTFTALAGFLDKQLPSDLFPPGNSYQQGAAGTMPGPGANNGEISRQLSIISRQLEMLGAVPPVSAPETMHTATDCRGSGSGLPQNYEDKPTESRSKTFGAAARIETDRDTALTQKQQGFLDRFIKVYNKRTKGSKRFTQAHRARHADPRVVSGFNPLLKELVYPIVVERSAGARVWDMDGNEYMDMTNSFGANLLGYSPPFIRQAIQTQVEKGFEIGPQHPLVGDVAQLLCELTGHERAAFCNTGSEAVLGAMRIARTVTGLNTIAVFSGAYHGINDEVIVRGTKSLKSIPAAAGVMPSSVENMLVLEYGTSASIEILKSRMDDLAAIMVEPVQSRNLHLQPGAFLKELRNITEHTETALIFDEVITGFRAHLGGAQAYFGVEADLATYGKIIGGGMPIGVVAGKKAYMNALDGGQWQFGDGSIPEVGVTYFAGTFVRHPLALAATKATLEYLKEQGPGLQENLNRKMAACVQALETFLKAVKAPVKIRHFSSAFRVVFEREHPCNALLYYLMRSKGIHILEGFTWFLTTAHTDGDIAFLVKAFKESIIELLEYGFLEPIEDSPREETEQPVKLSASVDATQPPIPGAKLGKDPKGHPAWFIKDPRRPGKYLQVENP